MELMRVLQKALDLNNPDHVMLWAACCVGFFGLLHAGEFTINSTFDPEIHLSVSDLQVDFLLNPLWLKIHIKCSKTDPFRSGCDIYFGKGNSDICPLAVVGSYLHVRGDAPGPLFLFRDGRPLSPQILAPKSNTSCSLLVIPGPQPQQPQVEYQIISSKPWAAGPLMCIKSTLEPLSHQLYRLPTVIIPRSLPWGVRIVLKINSTHG